MARFVVAIEAILQGGKFPLVDLFHVRRDLDVGSGRLGSQSGQNGLLLGFQGRQALN